MKIKKLKSPSFMQQYRSYNRSVFKGKVRPTLDDYCIRTYGKNLAYLFEKFDRVVHRGFGNCTLHTRINYRIHAVLQPTWKEQQKSLESMWRSWQI